MLLPEVRAPGYAPKATQTQHCPARCSPASVQPSARVAHLSIRSCALRQPLDSGLCRRQDGRHQSGQQRQSCRSKGHKAGGCCSKGTAAHRAVHILGCCNNAGQQAQDGLGLGPAHALPDLAEGQQGCLAGCGAPLLVDIPCNTCKCCQPLHTLTRTTDEVAKASSQHPLQHMQLL